MIVKLLTEHHLEFLSLKGGCRGFSESTLVKMSNCWKSHAAAHYYHLDMRLQNIAKKFWRSHAFVYRRTDGRMSGWSLYPPILCSGDKKHTKLPSMYNYVYVKDTYILQSLLCIQCVVATYTCSFQVSRPVSSPVEPKCRCTQRENEHNRQHHGSSNWFLMLADQYHK